MRVGLLVDSTCDLPSSMFERNHVKISENHLLFSNAYIDSRDMDSYASLYQNTPSKTWQSAYRTNIGPAKLSELILQNLIYEFDHVLIITPDFRISDFDTRIRENILNSESAIPNLRAAASLVRPFKTRIMHSGLAFSGYGLVLYEALRLINEKARTIDQLQAPLQTFPSTVENYVVPGVQSVKDDCLKNPIFGMNWLSIKRVQLQRTSPIFRYGVTGMEQVGQINNNEFLSGAFEMIYDRITQTKLTNHLVNISYAGNLAKLRVLPMFKLLVEHIHHKNGRVVYSMMSPTSALILGQGALSVSFSGGKV